ncbi:zinc finger protein Eos-like isoform X2 [Nerophis ophidion]|uniref:zinc finger protein Eos-like isoform X2 n=1 Tax=Nerophis ophidion TaxID=159077 RepID=UPI002AE0B060|nr:zinc finger protein Eos-like isoform X2 [Nerophis ophidion]
MLSFQCLAKSSMDVDDCNGQSYMSVSGESSMEREFSGGVGGPTVSTPNSKEASPHRSLSANSIKVELYSDEDPGPSNEDERVERVEEGGTDQGSTEAAGAYRELANHESIRLPNGKLKCDICGMICIGPNVLMVHKRSHTGERPFQCNQCGASFTQKGNLLRHIKLHSGEKPFKCPFCSYACRRRDALTGHLRTHAVSSPTVGKPYKCSYCARSYKQQSSLEEHLERCYNYLQSVESKQHNSAQNAGEEMREMEFIPDASSDKMTFIDRLAGNVTKRKRSMPQKFVGQKHIRVSLGIAPYDNGETHPGDLEVLHVPGPGGGGGGGGMVDTLQPLHLPTSHPPCLTELRSIHGAAHTPGAFSLGLDYTGGGPGGAGVGRREAAEGHEDLPMGRSSPSNGCQDSTDTESMPDEVCNSNNGHHVAPPPHYKRHGHAKDREMKREDGGYHAPPAPGLAPAPSSPAAPSSTSRETLRVVDGEGRTVRCFRCDHCRVLFLDHVMFTIHMGCHGFRQPLECNICGHRSRDRYEFSSHIVRGEHILD